MEVIFLETPYTGTVELSQDTLDHLKDKGYQKIGLYASVQFIGNLDSVKEQLAENNIEIIETKQLLGCDIYSVKEADAYLYIGDGRFHPLALVYAQKKVDVIKEVICDDPIGNKMTILTIKDIEKTLQKQKAGLTKFLSSQKIGVIITLKPGQEQLNNSFSIEKKYPNKKFYYFIDDKISFDQLENFPFIDVWVNTACPRIGLDDQEMFRGGVVNLRDVLD